VLAEQFLQAQGMGRNALLLLELAVEKRQRKSLNETTVTSAPAANAPCTATFRSF
jgi:hypothetical protein